MRKFKRLFSSIICCSLLLSSCGISEGAAKKTNYNILFIGNSYTYYNGMPLAIFAEIGRSAGYTFNVTSITSGGYTLERFLDVNDKFGSQVALELSAESYGKYDYVIIQEQSVRPVSDTDKFYASARTLVQLVRDAGATSVLYSTWGRKVGSKTLSDNYWTNESMTYQLASAYKNVGDELDVSVAHVGLAFFDVNTSEEIDIELYNKDLSHPSPEGSYLAAMTLFAKIFGDDPRSVEFVGGISAEDAAVLKDAAWRAVSQSPTIPDKYKVK